MQEREQKDTIPSVSVSMTWQGIQMVSMSYHSQENELTPEELELAYGHWEALMFANSRSALHKAHLELLDAPLAVRQAVMNSINDFWLREYEPSKTENPFR